MVDVKVDEQNNGVEAAAQEILEEDEIEKEEAKKDAQKKMNSSEDEKAAAPNCDQAKDDEKILVGPGIPLDAEKEKTDTTAGLTPMKDPKAATESTNGEEDSPPAPPSVLRRNDHASLMTPGAYSVTPTVNDTNRTATATPPTAATSTTITGTGEVNTNINNPSPQVATETDDEEQGLAVAKPVDGGIPDNVAQPVDPEKKERDAKRREEKRKRRHIWFSIGSVVIISLAVFLAVFFVSDDEDNSSINLVETSTDSPTPSPVVPEPPPEEILTALLPDDTVRLISFEDSSQGKAFRWVTEDPNFRSYSEKRLQQRFALATFWYATGDETWGPNWLNMSQHECTWEHFMPQDISFEFLIMRKSEHKFFSGPCLPIGLNYSTATLEETTASSKLEHDDILYLGLYQRQLSGQIPREITMLTSLKMLMLEGTTLEGTIPEVLTQLTSLHDLTLAGTNLHGTIPTEFSLMKELRTLIIGANRGIEGTLPTELGLLPNIKTLNVYETNVTGPIPIEYTKLPLEEMQIHNNFLTGTIPTEYGLLTKADWLAIELNQLVGSQ